MKMRVLLAWLLISRVISAEEYADEADGADLGLHERAAVEIGSSDGDVLQSELIGAMYDRRPLVREVLDLNDKLRGMGLGSQFDFPTIVVMGDQSAGKSSVLEAISGVQLLRGTGVVTRAPIELRLEQQSDLRATACFARVGADGVQPRRVPCDQIGNEINETMRALPGVQSTPTKRGEPAGRGVTDAVIRVRVTARGVPDLTLVDLPGLARVAVEGQSRDVPALTRELALRYIARPNTIILVVVPCNADLATAEALQLAAQVDPSGSRTVGVLTKPDLMDPGTEHLLSEVLDGRVVKLREHGYFVVRNRGQRAIENGVQLAEALQDEQAFFENHATFGRFVSGEGGGGRFGVPSLVKYLTQLLVSRIVAEVPAMAERVEERLLAERRLLAALGPPPPEEQDRKAFLLALTTDFAMRVRETTRGHYDMLDRDSAERGFLADLLANYRSFNDAVLAVAPRVNSSQYDERVVRVVRTQHGRESFYGFPSYDIFATLVRDLVLSVGAPAERCSSAVRARVLSMARAASAQSFAQRFPRLRRAVDAITKKLADDRHGDSVRAVAMLLEMQMQPFTQELLRDDRDETDREDEPDRDAPRRRNRRATSKPTSSSSDKSSARWDDARADDEPERPPPVRDPEANSGSPLGGLFASNAGGNRGAGKTAFRAQPLKAPSLAPTPPPPHPPPQREGGTVDAAAAREEDAHSYAVDFVKSKIERYFEILAERVGDLVPMAIDMYLVQRFGHDVSLLLANATHAFSDAHIHHLLQENAELTRKRAEIEDMLGKLQIARETLETFAQTFHDEENFS